MIKNAICVQYGNEEQVRWWNKVARSNLIKFEFLGQVFDEISGQATGAVFKIKGLFAKLVVRRNNKFIQDHKTIIFEAKN